MRDGQVDGGQPPVALSARSSSGHLDAAVFAAAGLCTCATILIIFSREVAGVASTLGSLLTLAGLFILSFGPADERPLRNVPAAQVALMCGAVAGLLQSVALSLGDGRTAVGAIAVIAPLAGLVGGCALVVAVVGLARARSRHSIRTVTLVGLSVIAVSAVTMNGVALIADHALLSSDPPGDAVALFTHCAVACSGVGQLVIAFGFWRHPLR